AKRLRQVGNLRCIREKLCATLAGRRLKSACYAAIIARLQTSTRYLLCPLGAAVVGALLSFGCASQSGSSISAKQQSLNEWRNLTAPAAPGPRVFVKGDQVRFYFPATNGVEVFRGHWSRLRVPTSGFRAHSALLHWEQNLSAVPKAESSWREATVIAG